MTHSDSQSLRPRPMFVQAGNAAAAATGDRGVLFGHSLTKEQTTGTCLVITLPKAHYFYPKPKDRIKVEEEE